MSRRKQIFVIITSVLLVNCIVLLAQISQPTNVRFTLRESSRTLPLGMWAVGVLADEFVVQKNTAATGNFGTSNTIILATGTQFTLSAADASWSMTLPTSNGSSNYFLRTDGAGTLTWATAGGSTTRPVDNIIQTTLKSTGSPVTSTVGTSDIVTQFPFAADSSVTITTFAIPVTAVASSSIITTLVYRADSAPGVTNNKITLKVACTKNGTASAYTSTDTITLANNTTPIKWRATNAICTSASANDTLAVVVYRVIGGANDAQVAFDVTQFGFEYTSTN